MESSGTTPGTGIGIRRDVWSLTAWDEIITWYARAIADMQTRPISDPTSWEYQAAIHGHEPETEQSKYWNQCQHGTSFFLPWHRGYLAWFEQTVRAAVTKLGGPGSWALPYWNYSSTTEANAIRLPEAFRAPTMPDGTPNPLYVAQRNLGVNVGDPIGDADDVSVAALDQAVFEGVGQGGGTGFGGPPVGFHHPPGQAGAVETTPHNNIHINVGGLMASFSTAPLDPIFWLHHANIDRLWEIWRHEPGRADPSRSQWLGFSFDLHDAAGNPITFDPSQTLATAAPPMSYEYDNLTDPRTPLGAVFHEGLPALTLPRTRPAPVLALPEKPPTKTPVPPVPPEMVGASRTPVTLATEASTTELAIEEPTGPIAQAFVAAPQDVHVYLNVENVVSEGPAMSYGVYLDLPPDVDPLERSDLLAGVLAPFGSERAAGPEDPHGGTGLHFTFDISRIVTQERLAGSWNPSSVRVTFVPRGRTPNPEPLHVGRVSIYYHH
jgi:tyrosinase